jgi:peptide/nickel transport system substrate-binding protein
MTLTRLLPAATLAALFSFAATAQPAATPKRGGTLEFAVESEPPNYDCHANTSFAFIHPVAPHYSTLLKFDAANYPDIVGDLAEVWTVSPDKKVYTFRLRPNIVFHDGSKLTATDVKASYERIIHPPQGVLSARQVNYAAIAAIETPDPRTVVFRLQWPEAAMLANFASPWNCIYSAAKIEKDPNFPKTNILGTGAFTFVEHKAGTYWTGKRFDKYFLRDRPYLDGYKATFMQGDATTKAFQAGAIMAEFRSVTPTQRDQLEASMGSKVIVGESPWVLCHMVIFNAKKPPFNDQRVRHALALALDRWAAAEQMSNTTFLKFVGGVMRPGFSMATAEADLTTLTGFSRDIEKSRAEARRLLKEAGAENLKFKFTNRNIPPYPDEGKFVVEQWRQIGVTVEEERLNTKGWTDALAEGKFDAAIDFVGDYLDDPTLQLTKYVSTDLSPGNFSGSQDSFLDALYVGQAVTTDLSKRAKIIREFERRAMSEAYTVPILWANRLVATSPRLKGWYITPSHYIEQDLVDVWIDNQAGPPR